MNRTKNTKNKQNDKNNSLVSSIIVAMLAGIICTFALSIEQVLTHGYNQAFINLKSLEQTQVNEMMARSTILSRFLKSVEGKAVFTESRIEKTINVEAKSLGMHKPKLSKSSIDIDLNQGWELFLESMVLVSFKILNVLSSIWVYVLASLIGVLDGLSQRYIRTAEAGRESTYVFHKLSSALSIFPALILFAYMTLPISINPTLVASILGLVFFGFFQLTFSNLKKYL